eukprot:NODE_594_length_2899_cov_2.085137.p1 GENE.NODE_594_length_2899_cov_2.085137~~NODE_594_length_2899_cov_2.085137.p1  ORF type:complete len:672 (+),score=113.11 NODE_594_length_2899_cov_2.085137:1-2016(+)
MLALVNVARRSRRLPVLPKNHVFEPADFLAVRVPDGDELRQANTIVRHLFLVTSRFVVRPRRSGRYPEYPWDGPPLRLVDGNATPRVRRCYDNVTRRVAVDNLCRRVFLGSCIGSNCPHPLDVEDAEQRARPSLFMQPILEAGDSAFPSRLMGVNSQLSQFLREARLLGVRPMHRGGGPESGRRIRRDPTTGVPMYRGAIWLTQRLRCYRLESWALAQKLVVLLLTFRETGGPDPRMFCVPVPFIMERWVRKVSAVVMLQSVWRAHVVRRQLPIGLHGAVALRRATICIQRAWRWSGLTRRLELFSAAARYVKALRVQTLYIEARLFAALNLISEIDRYGPFRTERSLGLAVSYESSHVVLVRGDLEGHPILRDRIRREKNPLRRNSWGFLQDALADNSMRREGGMPSWFWEVVGPIYAVGPDELSLKDVNGLQGLVTDGLGETSVLEAHAITVPATAVSFNVSGGTAEGCPSGGIFHFVELKFASMVQARQRALALFLGTWNSQHRIAVPLVAKPALHTIATFEEARRLWQIYGLTWPQADHRAVVFQLRQKIVRPLHEVVPFNGSTPRRTIKQHEWSNPGSVTALQRPRTRLTALRSAAASSGAHKPAPPALAAATAQTLPLPRSHRRICLSRTPWRASPTVLPRRCGRLSSARCRCRRCACWCWPERS